MPPVRTSPPSCAPCTNGLILNYLEAFGLTLNYLEVNGLTLNYLGNGLIIKPSDQGSASAWPLAAAPIGCATSILLI